MGSGSRNTPNSNAHFGLSLTDAVRGDGGRGRLWRTPDASVVSERMWPSPPSRDYRFPNALPYAERGGGTKGEQLPNAVGGTLNPTFVEWLLGLPKDWSKVD